MGVIIIGRKPRTTRTRAPYRRTRAHTQVARLVELGPNYLALAAVRLFKAVVALKDEFYTRYMTENEEIMAAIARAFSANGERYNMLNSAILDLFEQAHKVRACVGLLLLRAQA